MALHLSNPDKSAFFVLTEAQYNVLDVVKVQEILRRKHIVVQDCSFRTYNFDGVGLGTLAPLDRVVDVQGEPSQNRYLLLVT